MVHKLKITGLLMILAASACLMPAHNARAMTGEELFEDGNRLFRDDLYWAALLRYRQAVADGMNSAVVNYNMGIAHYRAGQHVRARDALLLAQSDPTLGYAASYNLGLNAYALGETEEALRWFRVARDQNANKKIANFAVIAISRIRDERLKPDDFDVRAVEREKKRDFTNLTLRANVGFGNDDNVFRTPDQNYIDTSDPAAPTITPVVQSGAFMPVSLSAKYLINSLKFEGFYIAYQLGGRYYQDKELENANEYQHQASFGSEYKRKEGTREREVHSAFTVAQHDETYYDPDDGSGRNVGGTNIDNRMDYLRYGPELSLRQSHQRIAIGARIKGQLWNYDTTDTVPEYDHEYFLLNLYGQYKFRGASLLRFTLEGYSRRFGDRLAFDLDGQQRAGNPTIRYDYYSFGLTARQRVFRSLWFGIDAKHTERIDQYLGYNDYSRDTGGIEIHWSPGERFDFDVKGEYHLYDYPAAFAFHDPNSGRKTQESINGKVELAFKMTPRLSLVAKALYRETVSNDIRIQYERRQITLGVRWKQ